ncbi:MAG: B12-binding domain-containing radical SAM protein [Candidatus Binataceae bacterium]
MKVTIVRPPYLMAAGTLPLPIAPPLGVAYLAGSLRAAGHQAVIVDSLGEAPFHQTPCFDDRMRAVGLPIADIVARIPDDSDLIGVSCMFSQDWPYARRVIQAVRQHFPHPLIVAGGEHITAWALQALATDPEIDLCVLGEGEETIVEIAECQARNGDFAELKGLAIRRGGKPVLTPPRDRIRNIDSIPPPAWDLTPVDAYLDNCLGYGVDRGRNLPALATRGCPYQCTFCSSPTMWTTRWMARDPGLLLDEIQGYIDRYQVTNIDFYDLTATMKKDWTLAFCELIEKRGMKFTFQVPQGTRSEVLDREVCGALYRARCRNLTYAPESGSPAVLKRIKKRIHLDKMRHSIRAAVKAGMIVKINTILGFPDETRREVWQTIALMARMALAGVHDVGIAVFSPYPGSELFNQLRERGKLPETDDEYFLSLAYYISLTNTAAYCDNLSSRELGRWRLVGYCAFFGVQFAVRPWRLFRTAYNLIVNRQESRADKTLHDFIQRRAAAKVANATS